jgi:hypothetical protein
MARPLEDADLRGWPAGTNVFAGDPPALASRFHKGLPAMSIQAMTWVIKNSRHKGSSFVVLLMIANHTHSDGSGAFPSFECLAQESRITPRQIANIIPILERSGELFVEHAKGPGGTNLYSLRMEQLILGTEKIAQRNQPRADFIGTVSNRKPNSKDKIRPHKPGAIYSHRSAQNSKHRNERLQREAEAQREAQVGRNENVATETQRDARNDAARRAFTQQLRRVATAKAI